MRDDSHSFICGYNAGGRIEVKIISHLHLFPCKKYKYIAVFAFSYSFFDVTSSEQQIEEKLRSKWRWKWKLRLFSKLSRTARDLQILLFK